MLRTARHFEMSPIYTALDVHQRTGNISPKKQDSTQTKHITPKKKLRSPDQRLLCGICPVASFYSVLTCPLDVMVEIGDFPAAG
ncbi:hypothetical protein NDU88_005562 [Pleurodeles waltl]|uniref:Uncharacterized protein n=1 Tax=Pleurodeles waltl TaxID=8319 RepID=A0AAV7MWQ4_PLEWA|nr:hypothetical protein NDU88_005562 [Pleurodeles waltl]